MPVPHDKLFEWMNIFPDENGKDETCIEFYNAPVHTVGECYHDTLTQLEEVPGIEHYWYQREYGEFYEVDDHVIVLATIYIKGQHSKEDVRKYFELEGEELEKYVAWKKLGGSVM